MTPRGVKPSMSETDWRCPVCKRSGTLKHKTNGQVQALCSAVLTAHAKASPDCPVHVMTIGAGAKFLRETPKDAGRFNLRVSLLAREVRA